jgi:hypothetical protein
VTLQNPEAEAFFSAREAHSDIAEVFVASLKRLGEYELRHAPSRYGYGAIYAITKTIVFCGVAGDLYTYWRLRPQDYDVALLTGAERSPIGSDWVKITSFRNNWPQPDLPFWALRAYDYARVGR